MDKKRFLFVLLTIFFITPSVATAVPHYGDLPVITDDKSNELILEGDTITIHNSIDTVVISRSDSGISFNDAYLTGVDWENSDLIGLDADLLDGLQGDSYLKSDRNDTFTGSVLYLDNNSIKNIDWTTSDDGAGSKLDADLWDGFEYSNIDSDGDNQVDEADDADNVRSTYKGNDIDNDGDGNVNYSDYSDDSDLLDGYEASDFSKTTSSDSRISVLDSGNFLGSIRNIDFDTNLIAKVKDVDTAYVEVDDSSVNAGSVDGESASDFASSTGGAGSRQAQDSDKVDGEDASDFASAVGGTGSRKAQDSEKYDGLSPTSGTSGQVLKTDGTNATWGTDDFEADEKIMAVTIPLSEVASGDTAQVIRHLPSSETMSIYRMGVKNDSFNSVTGLKAEIVNDAGTIIESTNSGNYEPSTSISSDNYIFRINNDSGGSENASAFFEIIYN